MNIAAFYRPATPGERASQIDQLISERNDLLKVLKDVEKLATELGAKGYPLNAMRKVITKAEGRS